MGIDLQKMRNKLNKVTGAEKRSEFWRPNEGENNIRIVPTPDGDPFKDRYFHYNVGSSGFLCPKKNFGDDCPVCNFANKLWNENDEDSKKMAKSMFAKQRFFSPVLVRGEEAEGIKVWGYGKMAYQKLLNIVLDPDYGDITDPGEGNDLKIIYEKMAGANYPTTDIRPRPRKSVLCDDRVGGDDRCAELLETVPNFETIFERKSSGDVQSILDTFLDEGGSEEVTRGQVKIDVNAGNKEQSSVEAAFNELIG